MSYDLDFQLWWPVSISSVLVTWIVQWLGPGDNFTFHFNPFHALSISRIISLWPLTLLTFIWVPSLQSNDKSSKHINNVFSEVKGAAQAIYVETLWFVFWYVILSVLLFLNSPKYIWTNLVDRLIMRNIKWSNHRILLFPFTHKAELLSAQ